MANHVEGGLDVSGEVCVSVMWGFSRTYATRQGSRNRDDATRVDPDAELPFSHRSTRTVSRAVGPLHTTSTPHLTWSLLHTHVNATQ
jgi:hypothetical protein